MAKQWSYLGLLTSAGLQTAMTVGAVKFGGVGGVAGVAEHLANHFGSVSAQTLSTPAASYGQIYGLYARANLAQDAARLAGIARGVANGALWAFHKMTNVANIIGAGATAFYGTAYLYCQSECIAQEMQ